jgi:hypothetical protein
MPILQINFKLNVPADLYTSSCHSVVQAIANVPGLRWKIWILNEPAQEAGGIYLFDTEQSLNDYLSGPIVAQLKTHPAITNVSIKQFNAIEDLTTITRGPISTMAASN